MNLNYPDILLVTSSIGGLQSTFFGSYLLTAKKGNISANRVLAFLLLALAIRMAKSVCYYFAQGHQIPHLFENIGYAAHISIAPFLLLYTRFFLSKDYSFRFASDGLHFIPSMIILILSPFLTPEFWLQQHGYTFSLLLMGIYLPLSFYNIKQRMTGATTNVEKQWIITLFIGIALLWAAYSANFFLGMIPYIIAPVIFSIVMYYIAYFGLRHHQLFSKEVKYRNSTFTFQEIENCFRKLDGLMTTGKLFKDPDLTLPKMSKKLGVSPNLLSQAVNEKMQQNFSEYINSHRIKEACCILGSSLSSHQKISAIATDTGFNTLSAFNTAFKKFTGTTPSGYRKRSASQVS